MLQPTVHLLDSPLWEETAQFEQVATIEMILQTHDSTTHSKQVAVFTVHTDFDFATCNTARAIFTNFPTFFKRCCALQLPRRTNCKLSVIVGSTGVAKKQELSVEGPFHEFLSFAVSVIF